MTQFLTGTIAIAVGGDADFDDGSTPGTLIVEDGTGKPNANSYISLEEANAYFIGKRLYSSAWTASTDDVKKTALIMGSRVLDQEVIWKGYRRFEDSGLYWPRTDVYTTDGVLVDEDTVPRAVREATAEMAMYLLVSDKMSERSGIGLTRLKVDVVELEFDKYDKKDTVPSFIRRMIIDYGTVFSSGNVRFRKLIRT